MYLINRVVCVSNDIRSAYNVEDDLEKTRKELVNLYQCERVYLEYEELI